MNKPAVIRHGVFSLQVCVPADWTNEQVKEFADTETPCGTTHGWHVRTGDSVIAGEQERVTCENESTFVHICLDA